MKENHNKDNILFYFVFFSFIVSILLGLIILITDFMKGPIPNYLKYGFKTIEVAKIYQKEYVPEIQEYIQTSDLPDITIKVDEYYGVARPLHTLRWKSPVNPLNKSTIFNIKICISWL